MMLTNNTTRLCLSLAAALVAGNSVATAQELNTQIILPDAIQTSSSFEGYAYGKALLVDPVPASDRGLEFQSIFLGTLGDPTLAPATIFRIDPDPNATPAFSGVTITPLDARFRFVTQLAYNTVQQALYAAGDVSVQNTRPKSTSVAWLVRESPYDRSGVANPWRNSEPPFMLATGSESRAQGIVVDPAGTVYVCGRAKDAKGFSHTLIRRKAPGGVWEKVCDRTSTSSVILENKMGYFSGSPTAPAAYLMVGNDNNKWTILRSLTGNLNSWTAVDTTWSVANSPAGAKNIAYDSQSRKIYVAGYRGTFGSGSNGWVVRVSADGGQTWSGLLDAVCSSYSYPDAVTTDAMGNVLVSGNVGVPSPNGSVLPQVHLVRCTNPSDALSWKASFLAGVPLPFDETNCESSFGPATTIDASGAVFLASAIYNWTDNRTWPATTYAGGNAGLLRLTPVAP